MRWKLCVVCELYWCRCVVVYPLQVVGDACVDAVVAWPGAALPPAHDAQQECGLLVLCHQRPAAVAFTRVLPARKVSGTKHVFSELYATLLDALLCTYARHPEAAQQM